MGFSLGYITHNMHTETTAGIIFGTCVTSLGFLIVVAFAYLYIASYECEDAMIFKKDLRSVPSSSICDDIQFSRINSITR